ncbi:MAG: hypothetical protein ACM3NQ_08325 [Bacteroidales bacterium]
MSPILLRPVREQLEHDRVIRLLQTKWRRRYQVGMNTGSEQGASVGPSTAPLYPDLVFWSNEGGKRVEGVVEVETSESVNNMEALAEWAPFSRLRAPFYLYIPNGSVENARRLINDNAIAVAEIWSYYLVGDQLRFALVHKSPVKAVKPAPKAAAKPAAKRVAARPAAGRRSGATPRSHGASTARRKATATASRRPAKSTAAAGRARQRPAKKTARPAARTQKRK